MPAEKTPRLDFAMPYDAPKQLKTIAETHPKALKNGWCYPDVSQVHSDWSE